MPLILPFTIQAQLTIGKSARSKKFKAAVQDSNLLAQAQREIDVQCVIFRSENFNLEPLSIGTGISYI